MLYFKFPLANLSGLSGLRRNCNNLLRGNDAKPHLTGCSRLKFIYEFHEGEQDKTIERLRCFFLFFLCEICVLRGV